MTLRYIGVNLKPKDLVSITGTIADVTLTCEEKQTRTTYLYLVGWVLPSSDVILMGLILLLHNIHKLADLSFWGNSGKCLEYHVPSSEALFLVTKCFTGRHCPQDHRVVGLRDTVKIIVFFSMAAFKEICGSKLGSTVSTFFHWLCFLVSYEGEIKFLISFCWVKTSKTMNFQ